MNKDEFNSDVVIIGGGIAGIGTALNLKNSPLKVSIVSHGNGITHYNSGLFDFIEDIEPETLPEIKNIWQKNCSALSLTIDEIDQAFKSLTENFNILTPFNISKKPCLNVSSSGDIFFSSTSEKPFLNLADFQSGKIAVISFWGLVSYKVPFICNELNNKIKHINNNLTFLPLKVDFFKRRSDPLMLSHELARLLEFKDAAHRLADTIKNALKKQENDWEAVLLPPILGIENWHKVMDQLNVELGIPFGEVIDEQSDIASLRLTKEIKKFFTKNPDIEFISAKADKASIEEKEITSFELNNQTTIKGKCYVLATGNIFGSGITYENENLRESLLNLKIKLPSDNKYKKDEINKIYPENLWCDSFFAKHPLFFAGVNVNKENRPVSDNGETIFNNLWLSGDIIYKKFGDPLSISRSFLSGWHTGRDIKKYLNVI